MSTKVKPASEPQGIDFLLNDQGSIFILTGRSEAGNEWMDEHLPEDAMRFGGGIVVEHRYIGDIIDGMRADGLVGRMW